MRLRTLIRLLVHTLEIALRKACTSLLSLSQCVTASYVKVLFLLSPYVKKIRCFYISHMNIYFVIKKKLMFFFSRRRKEALFSPIKQMGNLRPMDEWLKDLHCEAWQLGLRRLKESFWIELWCFWEENSKGLGSSISQNEIRLWRQWKMILRRQFRQAITNPRGQNRFWGCCNGMGSCHHWRVSVL